MKQVGAALRLSASDLVGFLNCHYLTQLELAVVAGLKDRPFAADPMLEVLRERGFRHEDAYLRHLESQGRRLTRIDDGDISPATVEQTRAAMAAGDEVIVQAALQDGRWAGKADVLLRVEVPSALGPWSYEVVDMKLARETKAGTILQLCLYSELVAQVQGRTPDQMYVIAPWRQFEPEPWRVADFAAYFRKVKAELEQTIATDQEQGLYPEPVPHCDVCNWRQSCEQKRREDDHLSLVAGVSRLQLGELESRGVSTMAALAAMPLPVEPRPERGSPESYVKVREQARIQVEARTEGVLKHELLPFEEGHGLGRLPNPTDADVFLDFEGDPFVGEHGLEYLLGYHFCGDDGEWTYRGAWALDREAEKAAFEEFIDFVVARREREPGLHVYHYGGYESGALKRLMGRYATREDELDDLLRGGVLVDLLSVVRQGVRASVESYSIKRLEPFYGFERAAPLGDVNVALRRVETSLELEDDEIAPADREVVEAYNRDDCVSTRMLRNWLEELRRELIAQGADVQRPSAPELVEIEELPERAARIAALVRQLTDDVPVDASVRSEEQQARWILAHLLEWHRREAKAVWWEFFRLADLPAEELLEERSGLFGLEFVETVGGTAKCPVHRYRFPLQEVDIRVTKKLKNVGGDDFGQVVDMRLEDRTIDIKKMKKTADLHPLAVFTHEYVGTRIMEDALLRLAEYVSQNGIDGDGPHRSARDLLLKRAPTLQEGTVLPLENEGSLETALRIVGRVRSTTLPIQGPPGSGKTFTGAHMICELIRQGKKVGVVANSHAVIRHLLECTVREAGKLGVDVQCIHKTDADGYTSDRIRTTTRPGPADTLAALAADCSVAGGTAWLWAHQDAYRALDVLFVDEAAQMSLANVLAASQAADSVVLLGDPQQLDQPTQGSHPDGTECSALDHVLNGKQTIDPHEGLFLAETWRLHPWICDFTSELFYESRLRSRAGLERQLVRSTAGLPSAGLMYVPVPHSGNQNSSPEEARVVSELVERILQSGSEWTDSENCSRRLTLEDILIITPYNAQVQQIQQRLSGARVGTVDKFQGQEAPIAIYSLATSSHADAPRGMEFLYSLNRLNVATSRARCLSIVVASPAVFEPECTTPRQLKLANAFCRFLELSGQGNEVAAAIAVN